MEERDSESKRDSQQRGRRLKRRTHSIAPHGQANQRAGNGGGNEGEPIESEDIVADVPRDGRRTEGWF